MLRFRQVLVYTAESVTDSFFCSLPHWHGSFPPPPSAFSRGGTKGYTTTRLATRDEQRYRPQHSSRRRILIGRSRGYQEVSLTREQNRAKSQRKKPPSRRGLQTKQRLKKTTMHSSAPSIPHPIPSHHHLSNTSLLSCKTRSRSGESLLKKHPKAAKKKNQKKTRPKSLIGESLKKHTTFFCSRKKHTKPNACLLHSQNTLRKGKKKTIIIHRILLRCASFRNFRRGGRFLLTRSR